MHRTGISALHTVRSTMRHQQWVPFPSLRHAAILTATHKNGHLVPAPCPPAKVFLHSGSPVVRLLSACCPLVVRLLSALKADNNRTTSGQQADNSPTGPLGEGLKETVGRDRHGPSSHCGVLPLICRATTHPHAIYKKNMLYDKKILKIKKIVYLHRRHHLQFQT